MRGNSHVRFLGEKGAVMPLTYPIHYEETLYMSSYSRGEYLLRITVGKKVYGEKLYYSGK